eukprot:scaffold38735_cov69-Phaeocystis_antarctica.AAC.2
MPTAGERLAAEERPARASKEISLPQRLPIRAVLELTHEGGAKPRLTPELEAVQVACGKPRALAIHQGHRYIGTVGAVETTGAAGAEGSTPGRRLEPAQSPGAFRLLTARLRAAHRSLSTSPIRVTSFAGLGRGCEEPEHDARDNGPGHRQRD